MSRFDDLLKIIRGVVEGFKLPESISVDNNKLSVNISFFKTEKPVVFNGTVININVDTPEGKAIAQQIFSSPEKLLNEGERIVEEEFGKLISDALPVARPQPSDSQLLENFKAFIPQKDVKIVEAALFVRRLYKGGGNVTRYKQLIVQKYGSRGNNIANLISAGYYEDYLRPIYMHLLETEPDLAIYIFGEIYEEAVTQYPFAVFVSIVKSYSQIKEEVTAKIQLNLLSEQHVLNIHGIGMQNKKTILKLLNDNDIARFYTSEPDVVELEKTVFVRIYF